MAGAATAARSSPTDRRATLRTAQVAAKRKRSYAMPNLGYAALGLGLMSSTPNIEEREAPEQNPQTQDDARRERFRREDRSNRVQDQISNLSGVNPGFRNRDAEEPLETIIEDTAEGQAELMSDNQSGRDTRTPSAKRNERQSRLQEGVDKTIQQGLQKAGDAVAKEASKIAIAYGSDVVSTGDSGVPADLGATQALTFAHKFASAVVTIVVPEPDTSQPIRSGADLKNRVQSSLLEAIIVRMGIMRMSRIGQTGGFIAQIFYISVIFIALIVLVAVIAAAVSAYQDFINNPLSTLFHFFVG